ncbi:UNVERIFIED_CONTAM: hypothetical protein RF653_16945 [Kocuria sp. CPCC 205316]|uniref:hypothetical protein n=1 Tax=Kocuria TaxID=57493 RepID=UPI0036DCF27A
MSQDPQQQAVDEYLAEKGLDYRPGDRMPWKAWERAVYKVSWRASAAGFLLMVIGLQGGLYTQPLFMPVAGVLLNAMWLAIIAFIPAYYRFYRVHDIVNPRQTRRKHVCVDQCDQHRHHYGVDTP